ncbi:bifunctional sugar phosphate isomerase/epimerase/4-hydroxyphenylpyruvate dioxygenase family protein [Thiofilum flexile]|uniref:bifunctional sugar phosphate isomerase/epimerase/4-hydroxyphenylpyruvate dioxygenase family protein n=1 Tax=Thiofilum flexile TaxID=125627 RepID=UPI00037923F1|nr:sugar phosphate isomerase/epimerase and 4-hydroxyphenylpyruvate domain-containing protein [Thiofilum flexile]
MKFAIVSSTLPGDLPEKLQAAARAGFQAVEIFEKDLLYSDKSPQELRELAAELGLSLISLQPFSDFEGLPAEQRSKALQRAQRKFDLMQKLGIKRLIVTSSTHPQASAELSHMARDLAELADLAAEQGLELAYEPLPWATHIRDIEAAFAVIQQAKRSNLGLVLDSFAFFARDTALHALTPALVERVMLVQLADSPSTTIDLQQIDRHFRCHAGQGILPLVSLVKQLQASSFNGIFSQKVPCEEFRASNPYQIARNGYRSLQWLIKQAEAEPQPQESLVSSIEFVELASQGGEANWLEQLLLALGFRKTHQHRSKEVALYRQGQINFLVNREPDSFANAYYDRHGTAVCALGLGSQQLAQVVENCREYRCDFVQSPHLPDEMTLPAIRNVGDGLLYLVDTAQVARFFEVDFIPLPNESVNPVGFGLTRIDHITQAVSSTEFLAVIQFYQILFGLTANAEYDLIDRNGIVHSRSLINADHSVQFPINTSHSRESSTERFRVGLSGSGVQHIALQCEDIFAVAKQLNPNHILPISPNYYEEVQADFLLDDALIERLRAYNILYDMNEQGEFFHIYTRHINGLFFEIVQRNNYQGFGERNAAARLAAQAREYQRMRELLLV